MIEFTDSLTRTKRPFEPIRDGEVSIYWCGPTVYDDPHLGHARSALGFDILTRYLRWRGFEVTLVRNVTDIDDNIIARAAQRGLSETEISQIYEAAYLTEMDRLGIISPDHSPHATDYVDEMIKVIATLLDRNMAYVVEGSGVYFDVSALDAYGALVNRDPDELRESAGARVALDDDKADPLDFALWKAAKPDEPTWDSPWGPGRPGWHIECVSMSVNLLGPHFDIHGGGDDLTFPHHENERAEALGAGQPFANYWIHNAMVQVEGEKMSKSLGNFTTLAEMLDAYDPRAFRLLVLQTHYRRTMEINASALDPAVTAIERLDTFARRARLAGFDGSGIARHEPSVDAFRNAMDDDLSTPAAIAVIFDTVRLANAALDADDPTAEALCNTVIELSAALGLVLDGADGAVDDDADTIDDLIAQRSTAREQRDFAGADRIRDELSAMGVTIEDGAMGTTWHR
ncbi:MAG: cysteine--tRNA ligase [Acidobacteria bacterium]|nr:cysteine--tRNA ligase [Acidobacteriota bacterium]